MTFECDKDNSISVVISSLKIIIIKCLFFYIRIINNISHMIILRVFLLLIFFF